MIGPGQSGGENASVGALVRKRLPCRVGAKGVLHNSAENHVAGPYLSAYADEMAWREDNRRRSNGEQYLMAAKATLAHPVSSRWCGYWDRKAA